MHEAQDLLKALAIVLGAAAVTMMVSRRLHQPVVLGYIVAGLVVGPHVPVPLVADPQIVHTLSELGVILLMFSLGLELSVRKLAGVGIGVAVTAVVECSILSWLGFTAGRLFGWTLTESLFTGAVVAISSTTIIAKAFEEQHVTGKLRTLVLGILVVEDLIAILLMASLTAIASGAGLSPLSVGRTVARLAVFLVLLIVIGLLVVPRAMRAVVASNRPEATAVASIALCFGVALLARELGYSVALGAFLAGSLVAESGEERKVEHVVAPLRDIFGAVFFVSVGMMLDPAVIIEHWRPVAALTVVVVVGKVLNVTLGAFLTGNGIRTSVQTGLSLAQIGEFSFIIAGLGLSLGATRGFLFPVAIAVSSITTLLTPWLVRASGPVAGWVDRQLPAPLQTFGALYGSWLERMRSGEGLSDGSARVRRLVRLLLVDGVAITFIVIGTALFGDNARAYVVSHGWLGPDLAKTALVLAAIAVSIPFAVGVLRVSHTLAVTLAARALPPLEQGLDLAAAPRRALVVSLQLATMLLVGAPVVALTQPFLHGFHGAELLLVGLVVLGATLWRTATNLQGHVRAGAEVVIEALARQTRTSSAESAPAPPTAPLTAVLEGLGEPLAIPLAPGSPAIGKTLGDLNLRGLTGATVLAITRADGALVLPDAREPLRPDDVLAVAGTRESVQAARALLTGAALA